MEEPPRTEGAQEPQAPKAEPDTDERGAAEGEASALAEDLPRRVMGVPCPECGQPLPAIPVEDPPKWRVPVGGPTLWGRVLATYEQDKVHKAFVRFCRERGCLDYAARRYRRRLDADPADERAKRALDEIQKQALAGLVPMVRRGKRERPAWVWAVMGIAAGLFALFVAYMLNRMHLIPLPFP